MKGENENIWTLHFELMDSRIEMWQLVIYLFYICRSNYNQDSWCAGLGSVDVSLPLIVAGPSSSLIK